MDAGGNLYVADSGSDTIRKITPAVVVTTVAGTVGAQGTQPGSLPGVLSGPSSVTVGAPGVL
jgi:DNA-binding beta-propeller fold protein YncE